MAGIYAHVDNTRGVHKAPANEVPRGALGVSYPVSKAIQDGLNPHGVNCIRDLNGNIRVWGARTWGGDANLDYKYINVRRLMLFLRESIDEGTQWVVFEPNDRSLWAKIVRNVSAFLTERLARRRSLRQHAAGGLLRQVRRQHQSAGSARPRARGHRNRRGPGEAGGIRDLPHQPVGRSANQID